MSENLPRFANPDPDALMHAVLDGESSAEQRAELDRLLAADPAARERFAGLQALFGVLSQVPPVEPPAHLLDGVVGQFDSIRGNFNASRQLFGHGRVIDSKARQLHIAHRPIQRRIANFKSLWEIIMVEKLGFISTTKGKLVVGAGAVAVIAAVVVFGVGGNRSVSDNDTDRLLPRRKW